MLNMFFFYKLKSGNKQRWKDLLISIIYSYTQATFIEHLLSANTSLDTRDGKTRQHIYS